MDLGHMRLDTQGRGFQIIPCCLVAPRRERPADSDPGKFYEKNVSELACCSLKRRTLKSTHTKSILTQGYENNEGMYEIRFRMINDCRHCSQLWFPFEVVLILTVAHVLTYRI